MVNIPLFAGFHMFHTCQVVNAGFLPINGINGGMTIRNMSTLKVDIDLGEGGVGVLSNGGNWVDGKQGQNVWSF